MKEQERDVLRCAVTFTTVYVEYRTRKQFSCCTESVVIVLNLGMYQKLLFTTVASCVRDVHAGCGFFATIHTKTDGVDDLDLRRVVFSWTKSFCRRNGC